MRGDSTGAVAVTMGAGDDGGGDVGPGERGEGCGGGGDGGPGKRERAAVRNRDGSGNGAVGAGGGVRLDAEAELFTGLCVTGGAMRREAGGQEWKTKKGRVTVDGRMESRLNR